MGCILGEPGGVVFDSAAKFEGRDPVESSDRLADRDEKRAVCRQLEPSRHMVPLVTNGSVTTLEESNHEPLR